MLFVSVLRVQGASFVHVTPWIGDFCPNRSFQFLFPMPEGSVYWLLLSVLGFTLSLDFLGSVFNCLQHHKHSALIRGQDLGGSTGRGVEEVVHG